MKKAMFAIFAALLCTALAFSAAATTFTKDDKITRKYKMDEDEEYIFSSADFSSKNLAQTIYVYVSSQWFWEDNGASLDCVEYDDGSISFDFTVPEQAYTPLPETGYYQMLITSICDWLSGEDLFDKWNFLSFYFNGTSKVVYLTKANFENIGGWMTVDPTEINRQLN